MADLRRWVNTPSSLQDLSLDVLTDAVVSFHAFWTRYGTRKVQFVLPAPVVEQLIYKMSKIKVVNDSLLKYLVSCAMTYEDIPNIKRLVLKDLDSSVTEDGLSCASKLELKQLSLETKVNAPISWHIACMKDHFHASSNSLTSLRCDYFGQATTSNITIIDFIVMFRNLMQLDLEIHPRNAMVFTDKNWTRIMYACPHLSRLSLWSRHEHCEFSGLTLNFLPKQMRKSFTNLQLQAAFSSLPPSFRLFKPVKDIPVIGSFDSLRHLDLSVDIDANMYSMDGIQGDLGSRALFAHRDYTSNVKDLLLTSCYSLPELLFLDISGLHDLANVYVEPFVKCHKKLQFLGLFLTETTYSQDPDCQGELVITGCEIECQIIAALEMYGTSRRGYALEALKCIYDVSKFWSHIHSHAIGLVLACLDAFPEDIDFHVAGTACLYNMTRPCASNPQFILNKVATTTLRILAANMSVVQVLKNCLLTFCQDDILQSARFDRFHLAQLCLLILKAYAIDQDPLITRMASIVLSIVAASLTSKETAALMNAEEIRLLLSIVKEVHENYHLVSTFRFTLSALWNLTDDCPGSCRLFVESGGMDLFMMFLQKFPCDTNITVKVLGALNNLAEVPRLCGVLLCDTLLAFISACLESSTEKSEVYFSGGIIANLLCDRDIELHDSSTLTDMLLRSVSTLGKLDFAIVTYRSFTPFHRMLASGIEAVEAWAVWAINHVCLTPSMLHYGKLMDAQCFALLEPHCHSKNEVIKSLADEVVTILRSRLTHVALCDSVV